MQDQLQACFIKVYLDWCQRSFIDQQVTVMYLIINQEFQPMTINWLQAKLTHTTANEILRSPEKIASSTFPFLIFLNHGSFFKLMFYSN